MDGITMADVAQLLPVGIELLVDGLSLPMNMPRRWLRQSAERTHQRCFPAAVRATHMQKGAGFQAERQAAKQRPVSAVAGKINNVEHRGHSALAIGVALSPFLKR